MTAYNPTINLLTTDICNLPLYISDADFDRISEIVESCISISKKDWDSFETSWDFQAHPLVPIEHRGSSLTVSGCYELWKHECDSRFSTLKQYEEEINRFFIDIYHLEGKLSDEIDDKDVTIRRADLQRDIRGLVSYAVGCMFGR